MTWPCGPCLRLRHDPRKQDRRQVRSHHDDVAATADHAAPCSCRLHHFVHCTIWGNSAPFRALRRRCGQTATQGPEKSASGADRPRAARWTDEPARGRLGPPRTRLQASWRRRLEVERGRSRGTSITAIIGSRLTGKDLRGMLPASRGSTTRGRGYEPWKVADRPSLLSTSRSACLELRASPSPPGRRPARPRHGPAPCRFPRGRGVASSGGAPSPGHSVWSFYLARAWCWV
jgi:hypothetical protein